MKIRFQGDWDFDQDVVSGVLRREPTVDFKTGASTELPGIPDDEVLARAAREGRVLVTHDRKAMPRTLLAFHLTLSERWSVIVRQM